MPNVSLPQVINQHIEKLPHSAQNEVLDFVLFLESRWAGKTKDAIASARADALKSIVQLNPFAGVDDPLAWQKNVRLDRILPHREQ